MVILNEFLIFTIPLLIGCTIAAKLSDVMYLDDVSDDYFNSKYGG